MKKNGLFLLTALTTLVFAACNDSDGDFAKNWAFASVCTLDNNDYYFRLDDEKTVYPSDKSRIGAYQAQQDTRAIIFFNLLKEGVAGYDHNVALYDVQDIYTGQTRIVTNEQEADELPDDMISFFGARVNSNYLNLGIGFHASDLSKHSFLLVRNTSTEPKPEDTKEGYLNLELRHDAAGDNDGYDYIDRYVSFRFDDDFKQLLEGQQGIILRVKTRLNGIRHILIELPREK